MLIPFQITLGCLSRDLAVSPEYERGLESFSADFPVSMHFCQGNAVNSPPSET